MNKIYSVIWSETRQAYIVVSEYARHTFAKTVLAVLAAGAVMVSGMGVASAATGEADGTLTVGSYNTIQKQTYDSASETYTKTNVKGINVDGTVNATNLNSRGNVTAAGTVSGKTITASGTIRGNSLISNGNISTDTGTISGKTITASGTIKGNSLISTGNISTDTGTISGAQVTASGSVAGQNVIGQNDVTAKNQVVGEKGVIDQSTTNGVAVSSTSTVGQNLTALDTRITDVKNYVLNETANNYVSKTDATVQDSDIIKSTNTIGENVTAVDGALHKEIAARIGADQAQDQVINQINQNVVDGFTALNQADANEAAARVAGDQALDTRITNVKDYVLSQTVTKDELSVGEGSDILKPENTIGENLVAEDAALHKEIAARIGADQAQDQVINQINQNMTDGFNTINTNMADGFTALAGADAAEQQGRITADKALAEGGKVTLSADGVLQNTTTTVADDGTVTSTSENITKANINKTIFINGEEGNLYAKGTIIGVKGLKDETTETGTYVKAGKTVGQNLNALDTQVGKNTTNITNVADAVDSGLSLDSNNVLQKTTKSVDDDGNITFTKSAAGTVIINQGKDNQVTIDETGITIGANSTHSDEHGFYAGGHSYDEAAAAINDEGEIKGASGNFLVNSDGDISAISSQGNQTNTLTTAADGTVISNTDNSSTSTFDVKADAITNTVSDGTDTTTVTTTSGKTKLTNTAGEHHTEMDYADVLKDLGVRGNTTLGTDASDKLTVKAISSFKENVTMDKNLDVAGDVSGKSFKVGNKTYIDSNGINANNQKITNVAPGELSASSKDAVNGSQLYATNRRIDSLDDRVDKVGANAAAMASLHPLDFDEDTKLSVAAAMGNYRSETAGAVGVFYRPTENVMLNLSTSFGNGENMVGGGVTFNLGKAGHKHIKKGEVDELKNKVNYLQARLDAFLSIFNPDMSQEFPDVPQNHWAYEAVSKLAGNGIVKGYEDGKYHGERSMTRYEMAEIIYNALSKGAKAERRLVEEFKPELQAMAARNNAKVK